LPISGQADYVSFRSRALRGKAPVAHSTPRQRDAVTGYKVMSLSRSKAVPRSRAGAVSNLRSRAIDKI